jgi:hypothetical protein
MTRQQVATVETDVPIDSTGEKIRRAVPGETLVALNVEGTESADYAVDISADGETWFADGETYSLTTSVSDQFRAAAAYIRVRVTTEASADETADIAIQEAR